MRQEQPKGGQERSGAGRDRKDEGKKQGRKHEKQKSETVKQRSGKAENERGRKARTNTSRKRQANKSRRQNGKPKSVCRKLKNKKTPRQIHLRCSQLPKFQETSACVDGRPCLQQTLAVAMTSGVRAEMGHWKALLEEWQKTARLTGRRSAAPSRI